MNPHLSEGQRVVFLIAAAVFVILGTARLLDQGNNPYDGYQTDGNNTVIQVNAAGPAAPAGLLAGDRIRSIDGIPVEDRRLLAQQGRARIGAATTLAVERRSPGAADGTLAVRSVSFNHAAPPANLAAPAFAAYVIGLGFLVCGLLACFKAPTRSGILFALTGLCLGASFLGAPFFPSYTIRTLVRSLSTLITVLGFASLFHLMLEFPKQKALLRKKHALKILYAPALLLSIFLLFLSVVQPRATSGLNQLTILLSGLFIVGYFGGAAVMLTHSYVRATPQERSRYGLHLVLGGILLGIIPVTVAVVFRILAPKLVLPGSNYYFLTILLVPAALIAAIMRPRREEEPGRGFERLNLEQQGR